MTMLQGSRLLIYNDYDCESDCTRQILGFYFSAQRLEIGNADDQAGKRQYKRLFAMIFTTIRIAKVKVTAQDKYWVFIFLLRGLK